MKSTRVNLSTSLTLCHIHARTSRSVLPGLPYDNFFRRLSAHLSVLLAIEVERAAALLRSIGLDRQIKRVETAEDKIVFAGATHDAFV